MIHKLRLSATLGLSILLLALTAAVFAVRPLHAADPVRNPPTAAALDYADQISRLVQNHRIDDLAKLTIPAGDAQNARLQAWTTDYVSEIQKQETQRDKLYTEAVSKAQDLLKRSRFVEGMARVVGAYQIAKDQDAFIKLDWVKDVTEKVAAQAADYEKQGRWLESLQLYSDLNTLYEIDTRYKPDMQRLARRTRLLGVYTPKVLFEMRKAIYEKLELEKGGLAETRPATAPASQPNGELHVKLPGPAPTTMPSSTTVPADFDDEPATFTRWQDLVENATVDMMKDSLTKARNDWVEETTYAGLLRGGVEALRLFLTTPELAKEFTGLADADQRAAFQNTLDEVVTRANAVKDRDSDLTASEASDLIQKVIDANNASIKLPEQVLVLEFTDGAMEKLDPFTAVIWPHEFDEFEKNTRGSFGGVGIQISLDKNPANVEQTAIKKEINKLETLGGEKPPALQPEENAGKVGARYKLVVITPLPDTPAFKAGIQAGDVITGIDGKSTVGISIDQAVHAIMGQPGTPVALTIKRGAQPDKEYQLKRAIIKVDSVKGFARDSNNTTRWEFMLDPDARIGYIRITGFQDETAQELRNALAALQNKGLRGLILDLRFNPGGLLNAAVDISDMFLDHGNIVSTRGRSAAARAHVWRADKDTAVPTNMPIVVLVNQYSASASEIFSGALKDLHRALIVGHRSFGKGSVQNLLRVGRSADTMAMMKLTMSYYYLPDGESLHRRDGDKKWGVDPDVAVDLTPKQLGELLKQRRDAEIIYRDGATQPAPATTEKSDPFNDTQLDTALLLLRLQLVQSGA